MLTLDIVAGGPDRVAAISTFSPAPENPGVPVGCCEMSGIYDPLRRHLWLAPGRRLLQPNGFVTVALAGDTTAGRPRAGSSRRRARMQPLLPPARVRRLR